MNLDCIYIILSKSFEKDRLYYLENYFKNNPINIPIEYIEPFYIGRDDNNINYSHYVPSLKKGEKMLAATFEKLFENILKNTSHQRIIIFESDVIFYPNFNEEISIILDEWINNANHPSIVFFGGASFSIPIIKEKKNKSILYLMNETRCCDSMLLDRLSIQIIYDKMKTTIITEPVDHLWNKYFSKELLGYWTNKSLTQQGSDLKVYKTILRSDDTNEVINYNSGVVKFKNSKNLKFNMKFY